MRWIAFLTLLALPIPASACSFCGGNIAGRATLREEFAKADAVIHGTLKNGKLGQDVTTGTTEFHFAQALKTNPFFDKQTIQILPRYIPGTEETILFFAVNKYKADSIRSVKGSAALATYLIGTSKLDPKKPSEMLAYYFIHLDSADAEVAGDAFLEIAKANEADIAAAKAVIDGKKLKALLANPKTPAERLGVYAMLLGLSGKPEDAATLQAMLAAPTERVTSNFGGILTGLTLLDSKSGWAATATILGDNKRDFGQRLSALAAAKYFQATHPKEGREEVVKLYRRLLTDADFVEIAIDDLRRWQWWDATADVLKLWKDTEARGMKKTLLRYALQCPEKAAADFVAKVRASDAKLVEAVEEYLKLEK